MARLNKRVLPLILVLILAGVFLATQGASAEEKKFNWKIGTLAPKDLGPSKIAQELIYPQLEKACNGRIKVKVYWGGVMGDDENIIQKIRIGQLDGAALSSEGTILACPEFSVVELPFLFNNYKEVDYIRDRMVGTFQGLFRKYGFNMSNWVDQDFDQIFSVKNPVATVADFGKCRFGSVHGAMEETLFKAMGAEAVQVNIPEAPSSFHQGIVNAGIGPCFYLVGAQLYTSVKYITPINIRYSPVVTLVSLKTWNQLPEECRKTIEQSYAMGTKVMCALMRESNQKYLAAIAKYGVTMVEVTPANYEQIKRKAMTIYKEMEGKAFPKALLDEIQAYLKEYRAKPDAPKIPAVVRPDLDMRLGPQETSAYMIAQFKKQEAEKDAAQKAVGAKPAPAAAPKK